MLDIGAIALIAAQSRLLGWAMKHRGSLQVVLNRKTDSS